MKYNQKARNFLKRFDSYFEKVKQEPDPELRSIKIEAMSRMLSIYAHTI